MSYTIYTTPAYILEKYETGEHDITLLLMTRNHGLLYVRATGVRKGTSKMRMHLHLWGQVQVSLVQGRIWRLTGVELLRAYPFTDIEYMTSILARLIHTVKRLHQGSHEGVHEYELVDMIMQTSGQVLDEDKEIFEIWAMIQILAVYGYWDDEKFSHKNPFDSASVFYIQGLRRELLVSINQALAATQLIDERQ